MKYSINNMRSILGAMLSICLFNSCYVSTPTGIPLERQKENIYYVPSTPVSTTLLEKNEFDFNLLRSSNSDFSGFEMQGAYLPTKHIGIITSFNHASNIDDWETYMHYNRVEIGAGYLKSLSNNTRFEIYGGAGYAKTKNYHATGLSNIHMGILFLQPAIGFYNESKTISFDIISKFSGVNFNISDTTFNANEESFSALQLKQIQDQPFNLMWEPALIFKAGWPNLLFHIGYTRSLNLTNADLNQSKGNVSLGISFHFNPKKEIKW